MLTNALAWVNDAVEVCLLPAVLISLIAVAVFGR